MTGLLVAWLLASGAAPVRGQATDSAGPPGSELSVYLMTMGQGDLVWERYGHNAIGIRDRRAGTDVVYNWGVFSFDEPGFIGRFLRGDMMYWMAGYDAAQTLAAYREINRTVEVQELNLSPAQRVALVDFIRWNAREENKYYRYDYFLDNCSTRVRDALNAILGGAIRQATDTVMTATTFRWHSLRLMAEDPLMSAGVDIGLGRPTDRPISRWEEMFIPMKVRDHLRDIRVPDESGRLVPLVTSERVLFQAERAAERTAPPQRLLPLALLGLLLGGGVAWLWRRGGSARTAAFVGAVVAGTLLGALGAMLLFLRFMTAHVAAWHNTNLLVYNPLWLLVLAALAVARGDRGRRIVSGLAALTGMLALFAIVAPFLPGLRTGSMAVIAMAAPVALAAAWVIRLRAVPVQPAAE